MTIAEISRKVVIASDVIDFVYSQATNELARKLENYAESSSGISSGASSPTNTNKPIKGGRFAGVWSRFKHNSLQRRLFH